MANRHLVRLQKLCDFVNAEADLIGVLYKQLLAEFALKRSGADANPAYIARNLRQALIFIAGALKYGTGAAELCDKIEGGYQIATLEGKAEVHPHINAFLPDIANCPQGALKVCANPKCSNPFASPFKNARFCCIKCRNIASTKRRAKKKPNDRSLTL